MTNPSFPVVAGLDGAFYAHLRSSRVPFWETDPILVWRNHLYEAQSPGCLGRKIKS